jgi:hypothetical protein
MLMIQGPENELQPLISGNIASADVPVGYHDACFLIHAICYQQVQNIRYGNCNIMFIVSADINIHSLKLLGCNLKF